MVKTGVVVNSRCCEVILTQIKKEKNPFFFKGAGGVYDIFNQKQVFIKFKIVFLSWLIKKEYEKKKSASFHRNCGHLELLMQKYTKQKLLNNTILISTQINIACPFNFGVVAGGIVA